MNKFIYLLIISIVGFGSSAIASGWTNIALSSVEPKNAAPLTTLTNSHRSNLRHQQIVQESGGCNGQEILTPSISCAGDGLEPEEEKLVELINQYRAENGLPAISISPSLTLVANRHVRDLENNIGSLTHGWSDCPYSADNSSTYKCMWEAPQRLGTPYPGNGFENAHGGSGWYTASAELALKSWKDSSFHNAVILNQGMWQGQTWKAIGVGIYGGYAVLWVGEEADPSS